MVPYAMYETCSSGLSNENNPTHYQDNHKHKADRMMSYDGDLITGKDIYIYISNNNIEISIEVYVFRHCNS